jgi:hypothetical protein
MDAKLNCKLIRNLTLIVLGDVKVDLADFDFKSLTNFLYMEFKKRPITAEPFCKSFIKHHTGRQKNGILTKLSRAYVRNPATAQPNQPPPPQFSVVSDQPKVGQLPTFCGLKYVWRGASTFQ